MYVPKLVFPKASRDCHTGLSADSGPEQAAVTQSSATSFFAYSPHNFLYKFFESRDLFNIERKFRFCKKLDIAQCFSNIYTHAISWAIKTKPEGKKEKNTKHTFDAIFDSTMRRSNDNETHGILVGSEISRIFAEVLLQQVDLEVYQDCSKHKLLEGKHYTVRRYVDDYFIFYNEEVSLSHVQQSLENRLKHYKLFLNPSKESCSERPFITTLSVCKNELRDAVILHFRNSRKKEQSRELSLISKTRSIIRSHSISYSDCSVYMMSQLISPLLQVLESIDINTASDQQEAKICEILQVAFSLFSIDTRFRTAFILGKMIIAIARKYTACSPVTRFGISDTIGSEIRHLLSLFIDRSDTKRLEICTLLTTIRGIPNIHPLPIELVESVCVPNSSLDDMNYFLIVTLLDLLGNDDSYKPLQQRVLSVALKRIDQAKMPIKDCEDFMLAIDLIASPFLDHSKRTAIISKIFEALYNAPPTKVQVATILADFDKGSVFFDWNRNIDLASLVAKKELAFTY